MRICLQVLVASNFWQALLTVERSLEVLIALGITRPRQCTAYRPLPQVAACMAGLLAFPTAEAGGAPAAGMPKPERGNDLGGGVFF